MSFVHKEIALYALRYRCIFDGTVPLSPVTPDGANVNVYGFAHLSFFGTIFRVENKQIHQRRW